MNCAVNKNTRVAKQLVMKNLFRELSRSQFFRNVMTVASGAAASQTIAMAFSPLITRLYGPETYGLMGIFASLLGILSVFAGLTYPMAIVLPRSDADALGLVRLSIYIGVVMSLLTTLALLFVGTDILRVLNAEAISAYIYLIPVAMFVSVITSVLGQWLIRNKAFALSAKYGVLTTFLISSVKTGMGYIHPVAISLILTNIVGGLIGSALTYLGWLNLSAKQSKNKRNNQRSNNLGRLAKLHSDFPLFRMPQNLINAFSQSLPVLLLAGYFGASTAAQYTIAIAVLGIPARLIGSSVMSVFYPRINEAIHDGEDARSLIIRATSGMAITGAVPFLVIIFVGPPVFEFVYGEEWRTAGEFSQWLAPWIFFQYINKPAVSAIPALRIQGGLLIYELFSTGTKVLAFWLGVVIFQDKIAAVAMYAISGVIAYIWLILWVVRRSKTC